MAHYNQNRESEFTIRNTPTFRRVCKIAKKQLLASLCLSVRMQQLGSHWMDFYEIWYLSIFLKIVKKIHVSLKSDKNNS